MRWAAPDDAEPRSGDRWVRWSIRLYGAAQRLLPADLVRAHGAEMRCAYGVRAKQVRSQEGLLALGLLLARALTDVMMYSLHARLQQVPPPVGTGRRRGRGDFMSALLMDVRLAARNLVRRPGFTVVAVLTLALGIGANVAMFAVVHAVLLRPLPFPAPDRIVAIRHHAPGLNLPDLDNSSGTIAVYREQARSFAHMAAVANRPHNLSGSDVPARVQAATVSPAVFDVLQVEPAFGRRLLPSDAEPGAARVAVLTHAAWQTHFGGADDVIGRMLELDGVAREIVGVMPPRFAYPSPTTAALLPWPEVSQPTFGDFGISGIARLAPGVSLAVATAEIEALQSVHVERFSLPPELFENAQWRVSVQTLHATIVGNTARLLWVVLGTAGFLLLVACAGVANLFLVRADARQHEMGVRLALGASRRRLASALLSESVLLGACGGVAGVLLAWYAVGLVVASGPAQLPRLHEVVLSAPVLAFAAVVTVAAGLLLGLLPLPRQLKRASAAIARNGRGEIGGRDRQRLRRGLIVTQIAVALVLLTGSGLMLRSYQQLRSVDLGVEPAGSLIVGVSGSDRDAERSTARYLEMLDAVRQIGGARVASVTNLLPIAADEAVGTSFAVEGRAQPDGTVDPVTFFAGIADDYFAAAGTTLLAGRGIRRDELADGRRVAVVNELFARSFLDGDPLGRRIRFDLDEAWYEVVGVAANVPVFGLREELQFLVYVPFTARPGAARVQTAHILVRTELPPLSLAQPVRERLRDVDPHAPVLAARTMDAVLAESLADVTFTSTALALAALLALLLGAVGLYGVIAYTIAERRSEIGVRVALGATPGAVRDLVLREGAILAGIGIMVGLAGAIVLTRFLESLLFETSTRDPLIFAAVAAVLAATTLAATWLPAHRAASIDPLDAIRGTG